MCFFFFFFLPPLNIWISRDSWICGCGPGFGQLPVKLHQRVCTPNICNGQWSTVYLILITSPLSSSLNHLYVKWNSSVSRFPRKDSWVVLISKNSLAMYEMFTPSFKLKEVDGVLHCFLGLIVDDNKLDANLISFLFFFFPCLETQRVLSFLKFNDFTRIYLTVNCSRLISGNKTWSQSILNMQIQVFISEDFSWTMVFNISSLHWELGCRRTDLGETFTLCVLCYMLLPIQK